jgi:type VI secretion system protein ImpJ
MRQLQSVVWAKGTFLTPQHLQAQDRFLENLLQFHLENLSFRPYGFSRLKIDREALAAGQFSIAEASGLFPDGLPFDIPGSDLPPPPKILAQYLEGDVSSIDIYMAIPPHVEGGLNVSTPARGADTRYLAEVLMLRDENTGLAEKPVQVARKNFRLLVGDEAREGTPVLRAGRIRKLPSGMLQLDPQFVPPLLNISASEYLTSLLRRLVEILVARSSTLAGMRRQRNQSLADFTAGDIANFWLLYTVNSHLPVFRHILETRKGHPEPLFAAMNSLAGALTTFSLKLQPRDLPIYDHDELGVCFTDLDEKLRQLLETVVPSNFVTLPLKVTQPFVHATALDDEKLLQNTKFYLAIRAGISEPDLITRTPQLIKVCSATHIETLIRQALPGVPLRHEPVPPSAIPIQLNYQYFSLNQSGAAWESILRARNFAAYVPAEFPDANLELVILLPQGA